MKITAKQLFAKGEECADQLPNVFSINEENGNQGAKMQKNVERDVIIRTFGAEYALENSEMSRGGDGQKFSQALNNAV